MLIKKQETNLKTFKTDDGLEIIIDTKTGESFASIKGYARLSGKGKSTIQDRLKSPKLMGRKNLVKEAEINTEQGLRMGRLITERLIAEWLPKDNPERATLLIMAGARKYFHTIAGFEKTSGVSKADLDSMKQDIINEIRATNAPINRLDSLVKDTGARLLDAIKTLKELQPRTNEILSVIPSGYLTYAEFKDVHNYAFKRGKWALVERNLDSNSVIDKSPLNSVKYYNEQAVKDSINSLNVSGKITITYGKTGNAVKATVS